MKDIIENEFNEHIKIANSIHCLTDSIAISAQLCIDCLKNGGKIILFGNGGSAADAQHLATELMGGMTDHDRMPIPSIALTTDSSFITAWTNDTDFDSIFSRQIQGLGNQGDVLIGISTSGNSVNVINAIKQANFKKLKTIALTEAKTDYLN